MTEPAEQTLTKVLENLRVQVSEKWVQTQPNSGPCNCLICLICNTKAQFNADHIYSFIRQHGLQAKHMGEFYRWAFDDTRTKDQILNVIDLAIIVAKAQEL